MSGKQRKGLLIVNTGDGKGKTTAAFGMAVRNLGWERKVSIVQFAKGGWETGELRFMRRNSIDIVPAWEDERWFETSVEKRQELTAKAMELTRKLLGDNSIDLLILDEINIIMRYQMVTPAEILPLLHGRPEKMTVILTGRSALQEIIEAADLVSEINDVKHPAQNGLPPQKGIEF